MRATTVIFVFLFTCSWSFSSNALQYSPSQFELVYQMLQNKNYEKTEVYLNSLPDMLVDKSLKAKKYFLLGYAKYHNSRYKESLTFLNDSLDHNFLAPELTYFYLGLVNFKLANYSKAKKNFDQIFTLGAPKELKEKSYYHLSQMAQTQQKWKEADDYLIKLEKISKGKDLYPEILWNLTYVKLKQKQKKTACKWAKILYSKYPSNAYVQSWNVDFNKIAIRDQKISCDVSFSDHNRRIRFLSFNGKFKQVETELDFVKNKFSKKKSKELSDLEVSHLIKIGALDEAFKVLEEQYKERNSDYKYLMLLAKVASRSGELETATGAYMKAFLENPKNTRGENSLFLAAFLNYQFKQYELAIKKFKLYLERFPKSRKKEKVQWLIVWNQYLSEKYEASNKGLNLLVKSIKKNPKKYKDISFEQIVFWKAMIQFKLGNISNANILFKSLADKKYGYYALAAKQRLDFSKTINIGKTQSSKSINEQAHEDQILDYLYSKPILSKKEEKKSDKLLKKEILAKKKLNEKYLKSEKDEFVKIDAHIKRVHFFKKMGFESMAHEELVKVERLGGGSSKFKKNIVTEYQSMKSYYKGASLGQHYFSNERDELGMDRGSWYWKVSYPKAYEHYVEKFAKDYEVPSSFIYSIMRAESLYRKGAISPVGARGLMQVMPYTGEQLARLLQIKNFDFVSLMKPEVSIQFGSRYLHRLLKVFNNQMPLVTASYNAGPHRVKSWLNKFGHLDMDEFIEHIPYKETRNYVKKIIKYSDAYNRLYVKDDLFKLSLNKPVGVKFSSKPPTKENWNEI